MGEIKQVWEATHSSWETSAIFNEDGDCIAHVFINDAVTEETQEQYEALKEARAHLIAAAPEMKEALERARHLIDTLDAVATFELEDAKLHMSVLAVIEAALAKANGEAPQ